VHYSAITIFNNLPHNIKDLANKLVPFQNALKRFLLMNSFYNNKEYFNYQRYSIEIGFGGLGVACWPLVAKFAGSNPAEAVRIFQGKKILSTPSFGGEVKPSVPRRRFAACKRSLNLRGSRNLGKITTGHLSRPQFPFAARISRVVADGGTWRLKWERLKAGGKQCKLPPRTCPGCSVPEPYQSHDWALVPVKPGLQG